MIHISPIKSIPIYYYSYVKNKIDKYLDLRLSFLGKKVYTYSLKRTNDQTFKPAYRTGRRLVASTLSRFIASTLVMLIKLNHIIIFSLFAFFISWILYPLYIKFLRKYKLGKTIREDAVTGEKSTIFSKMHEHKKGTPTMGG
jgi:hypothetical protein